MEIEIFTFCDYTAGHERSFRSFIPLTRYSQSNILVRMPAVVALRLRFSADEMGKIQIKNQKLLTTKERVG